MRVYVHFLKHLKSYSAHTTQKAKYVSMKYKGCETAYPSASKTINNLTSSIPLLNKG